MRLQDFANCDEVVIATKVHGKMREGPNGSGLSRKAILSEILRVHIALAWLLQKEPVTAPIIGATKLSHLDYAAGALAVKLAPEDVAYLEESYVPHRLAEVEGMLLVRLLLGRSAAAPLGNKLLRGHGSRVSTRARAGHGIWCRGVLEPGHGMRRHGTLNYRYDSIVPISS